MENSAAKRDEHWFEDGDNKVAMYAWLAANPDRWDEEVELPAVPVSQMAPQMPPQVASQVQPQVSGTASSIHIAD